MKTELIRGAIVVAAVAGMSMGGAAVAHAGPNGGCASSPAKLCLFENNDYNQGNTQHWLNFRDDDSDFRDNYWKNAQSDGTNDSIDNETSSLKNRSGVTVRLYQHVGATGAYSDFANGASDGFLSNDSIGDNRASAVKFL